MNAQDGGGREKRVLVVDDCMDTTSMMKLLLKLLGYAVRTANNGGDAISVAEEFLPHVVLLDLSLPDMPGEDVAAELRRNQAFSDALIVAVSGFGDEGVPEGFDHRLVKPVDHEVLSKMLAHQTKNAGKTASADHRASGIPRHGPGAHLVEA